MSKKRVEKVINYEALGKRIQKRRQHFRLSQSVAAEKLDLSTSFYSRIERGEKVASMETLIKIANFYELSLDYILQESLINSVSKNTQTELTQIFADKTSDETTRLLEWIKMLSDNINKLVE